MIKKSIVGIIVIVAAAALVFAASGSAGHTNSINQEKQQNLSVSNSKSNSISTSDKINQTKRISAAKAKKIAQKYIEEPGATAGTPKLSKVSGKYVYTVPVMLNGTNVGEIDINAYNGKNVGGAGGAP